MEARTARTEAMRSDALAVAARLRAAGHEALLCGGAVRDLLMGREPKDFDVATSATPEEGAALFPEAVKVGAKFGVLVLPREHGDIELASFRADGLYDHVLANAGADAVVMVKDEDHCIRCGLCAERCPTHAMTMEHFDTTVHAAGVHG